MPVICNASPATPPTACTPGRVSRFTSRDPSSLARFGNTCALYSIRESNSTRGFQPHSYPPKRTQPMAISCDEMEQVKSTRPLKLNRNDTNRDSGSQVVLASTTFQWVRSIGNSCPSAFYNPFYNSVHALLSLASIRSVKTSSVSPGETCA